LRERIVGFELTRLGICGNGAEQSTHDLRAHLGPSTASRPREAANAGRAEKRRSLLEETGIFGRSQANSLQAAEPRQQFAERRRSGRPWRCPAKHFGGRFFVSFGDKPEKINVVLAKQPATSGHSTIHSR